jgi:hypothetical protein
MATPWLKRIKNTGQLTVHNKATTWSVPVESAIKSFNSLSLGVKLVPEQNEKDANIVVVLANGPAKYNYYGDTASTKDDFKYDQLHGQTSTLTDKKRNEIFFAAIFLPGKIKDANKSQKEMVLVHEFIHACGLNDQAHDHDSAGIMFSAMNMKDGGLVEALAEKNTKAMPPIRVGSKTMCKMKMLWASGEACEE